MLDYEIYMEEYELFSKYCKDDEIFDLTAQPDDLIATGGSCKAPTKYKQ